jgi:hypothetical protein
MVHASKQICSQPVTIFSYPPDIFFHYLITLSPLHNFLFSPPLSPHPEVRIVHV